MVEGQCQGLNLECRMSTEGEHPYLSNMLSGGAM